MKKLYTLLFILSMNVLTAQEVVGYLPYYKFGYLENIDFSKITQVNIAFGNPKPNGDIYLPSGEIAPVVQKAKANDVVPYISLGGGLTAEWKSIYKKLMTKQNTPAFCQKIKDFCLKNELQGVDMDLEWSNVTDLYSDFVITLNDTLDAYGLGLTAAFPGTTRYSNVSDKALAVFDVINMMVYDYTGPWDPSNPGQHSPYSRAVESIKYWTSQGVSLSKLTLGVPFYGYDFTNSSNVKSFTFWSIVQDNPNNATKNQVGKKYYNGMTLIGAKAKLAKSKNLLGIMIWELGQDAFESEKEYSLLGVISQEMVANDDIPSEQNHILVYPNPVYDILNLESNMDYQEDVKISIFDMNGKIVSRNIYDFNNRIQLDLSELPSGMYFYTILSNENMVTGKISKL